MFPRQVGPFRVLERIGSGGMGEVYLAEDPRLGRRVALKRMWRSAERHPEARRRLQREARAAAVLSHPNIATIYDVLEHEGESFIVMEYVEGETLGGRIARGPLGAEAVIDLGIQLAGALSVAHAHGVVHRDVKPSNVIVTAGGVAKVLDFGLAVRPEASESRITSSSTVVGTPGYMAPEQALGLPVGPRTDLYSLGLVLLECLLGRLPGGDSEERRHALRALVEAGSEPAASLAAVLSRAVAFDPEERYRSAEELRSALTGVTSDFAERETRSFTGSRRERRRRSSLVAGAIGVASMLVLLYVLVLEQVPSGPEMPAAPIVAVLPLANASGNPSLDYLGIGIAHSLVSSLSRLPAITMVSPSDASELAKSAGNVGAIARELGATFVVNGTVQQVLDVLNLSVHLVDQNDSVVWASEYQGSASDLFDLQRRLSLGLTEALRLKLSSADRERLDERPTRSNEAYAEYAQGHAFLDRADLEGNVDRAIALFRRAIERDRGFAAAHSGLGTAYLTKYSLTRENDWIPRAREALERARAIDADNPEVLYGLARIHEQTGSTEEALRVLDHALALRPNLDEAHALRARILAQQGKVEEAAVGYRRAIEIRPAFWGHHRALGLLYYRAGRYYEAIDALKRVTELQPDMAWGYQTLGLAHHAVGDLDRAEANYRKALEFGGTAATYSNLGTIEYRQESFEEAVELYLRALELQPRSPTTHRNLGDALVRLDRIAEARLSYERAIELLNERLQVNAKEAASLSARALLEAKLGRTTDALSGIDQASELSPEDAWVQYDRAAVLSIAGREQDALAALALALQLGYAREEARLDEDLAAIRNTPEFRQLTRPTVQ